MLVVRSALSLVLLQSRRLEKHVAPTPFRIPSDQRTIVSGFLVVGAKISWFCSVLKHSKVGSSWVKSLKILSVVLAWNWVLVEINQKYAKYSFSTHTHEHTRASQTKVTNTRQKISLWERAVAETRGLAAQCFLQCCTYPSLKQHAELIPVLRSAYYSVVFWHALFVFVVDRRKAKEFEDAYCRARARDWWVRKRSHSCALHARVNLFSKCPVLAKLCKSLVVNLLQKFRFR